MAVTDEGRFDDAEERSRSSRKEDHWHAPSSAAEERGMGLSSIGLPRIYLHSCCIRNVISLLITYFKSTNNIKPVK